MMALIRRKQATRAALINGVVSHWVHEENRYCDEIQTLIAMDPTKKRDRRLMDKLNELGVPDAVKRGVVKELYFRERSNFYKRERAYKQKIDLLREKYLSLRDFVARNQSAQETFANFLNPGSTLGAVQSELSQATQSLRSALEKPPEFVFTSDMFPLSALMVAYRDLGPSIQDALNAKEAKMQASLQSFHHQDESSLPHSEIPERHSNAISLADSDELAFELGESVSQPTSPVGNSLPTAPSETGEEEEDMEIGIFPRALTTSELSFWRKSSMNRKQSSSVVGPSVLDNSKARPLKRLSSLRIIPQPTLNRRTSGPRLTTGPTPTLKPQLQQLRQLVVTSPLTTPTNPDADVGANVDLDGILSRAFNGGSVQYPSSSSYESLRPTTLSPNLGPALPPFGRNSPPSRNHQLKPLQRPTPTTLDNAESPPKALLSRPSLFGDKLRAHLLSPGTNQVENGTSPVARPPSRPILTAI